MIYVQLTSYFQEVGAFPTNVRLGKDVLKTFWKMKNCFTEDVEILEINKCLLGYLNFPNT